MEQNMRNRRSFSNEESYDQDQNRYNQSGYGNSRGYSSDYGNDWNHNRNYGNYGNSGRGNYGQDYGGYGSGRMSQDRDYDRWNDNNNANYDNRGSNYGRSGSYSDWDFQNGANRSRDFDNFSNDYYNRNSGGNYGQNYGSGYDYNRSYGEGSSNFRQGNYDNRYGAQDYGRYNRSQDYGRNRDWDNDYRNDRNDRSWWDKTKDEVASWFGDDDAERRRRMDERREGNYRGKGPKNYTRSSDRIKEDVSDRLSDAWDIDASDIDVSVDGNEVTLSGTVPSKQQKRRAEDIAESVSGVHNVQNNLRVKQREFNQSNDWNNSGSSANRSSYSGANTTTGSTSMGTTTGSASTVGTTGTTSSPSNQVKIEKSSAS